ncbi:MAG: hypothetical protein JWQ90_2917 [Hydrocarboniphaga sp.]|uniref:CHRD domain-containing protein n=1 Tax=Hydrocarboniphaga sp. TaxID=2033016 RepID=UPI0026279919|nr:CHRD domain-containing protein [Hydrocarboniphaga sp.]MDB5970467.1 hypothetical protein [Hydrocarboniphaga sp.]
MNHTIKMYRAAGSAATLVLLALSIGAAHAGDVKVKLSGDQETPAVTTSATGVGSFSVADDRSLTGTVKTSGLADATVAHIHVGVAGQKGGPVVTLNKLADNEWNVPAGTTLSDADYESFKAGKLYVNVHSAANKGGEIRGQLQP